MLVNYTVADPSEIFGRGHVMDLFTEFFRRLSTELSPILKWAIRHWPVILSCFIAAILVVKYWKKRKW
jgi:hypothetical protein